VAQELRKHFPETEYLLDVNKVKSKLNQSLKRNYDTFVACKDASGFGWDKTSCEVTAADDVWERYVAVSLITHYKVVINLSSLIDLFMIL
jgi:hypothetical protein